MDKPTIANRTPIPFDVEAGKNYFWCACGKSENQPFCDGSHQGTFFAPVKWTASETKKVFFCACKHTQGQPFCDGSHAKL
ncbi:MAG: CDGSH iron-sulfur domain-containing protein [Pseudomonadota bacterium]